MKNIPRLIYGEVTDFHVVYELSCEAIVDRPDIDIKEIKWGIINPKSDSFPEYGYIVSFKLTGRPRNAYVKKEELK